MRQWTRPQLVQILACRYLVIICEDRDSVDHNCLVWNQWDGSSEIPRAVRSDKLTRSVARKVQENEIYPGPMNAPSPGSDRACFVSDGSVIMFRDAEILSVHPNCSLAWVPYTAEEPLQSHHNEPGGVSSHQPRDCLLSRLIRRRSKKTSKLRVTGLCAGNSPMTGEFPAQMASNAEYVSIRWRHHDHSQNGLL